MASSLLEVEVANITSKSVFGEESGPNRWNKLKFFGRNLDRGYGKLFKYTVTPFELIPANNKFTSFLIVLLSSYMSSQYVKSFEVAVHIFKNLGGFSLISLR